MWSLTSLRTKRISSFRKFRLLPPKDFFDSIGQKQTSSCEYSVSALLSTANIYQGDGYVSFVPSADISLSLVAVMKTTTCERAPCCCL